MWNQVGPPILLKGDDITYLLSNLARNSGNSISADELRRNIEERNRKSVEERGLVPITSNSTLTNYSALVAHAEGESITNTVVRKTTG